MAATNDVLKELLREEALKRGLIGSHEDAWARLELETFPQQAEFITDESKRSTLCTPRRAAKTEAIIRKMLRMAKRKPGSRSVYISMTRDNAKRNVWSRLQVMSSRYGLAFVANHTELILRDPVTRSEIWVTGLANEKELAKLRGNSYDLVFVDEAQDILIDFESFIMSVILPALGDRRGQLVVAGTPDPWRRNQWWFASRNSEALRWARWKRFGWLLTDNIFFPDPEGYLREIREQEGYTEDDPRYQAEYLGLWSVSKSNLVIDSYEAARNALSLEDAAAKTAGYHYLVGLDPAFKDHTAFVVAAYSTSKRHVVFPESFSRPNMIVSDTAIAVEELMRRYPIEQVVCDEAGLGKSIAEELIQRYSIPIIAAEKRDKRMRLAFLNSDLRTGRLQVVTEQNTELLGQWASVLWDKDHQREAEGQDADLFDAAGYAHMACRNFFDAETVGVVTDAGEQYWVEQMEKARAEREGWEY